MSWRKIQFLDQILEVIASHFLRFISLKMTNMGETLRYFEILLLNKKALKRSQSVCTEIFAVCRKWWHAAQHYRHHNYQQMQTQNAAAIRNFITTSYSSIRAFTRVVKKPPTTRILVQQKCTIGMHMPPIGVLWS